MLRFGRPAVLDAAVGVVAMEIASPHDFERVPVDQIIVIASELLESQPAAVWHQLSVAIG